MQISDEAIKEYIQIYKDDFGEELSMEQAREIGTRLVELYLVLSRPLPQRAPLPPPGSQYHSNG